MKVDEVKKELWRAYQDWNGLLVNPRFCRDGNRIAWTRYDLGIIRDPITYEKVRSLVESKQYSFQCAEDGSVFQLLYEFNDLSELVLARLAFYKAAMPLKFDNFAIGPVSERPDDFVPWLRFDYTEEYATGILHHASHLHISGFHDARFVVAGVPGPRQFIEFVTATCYPEFYKIHRLLSNGELVEPRKLKELNLRCKEPVGGEAESAIIHLRIP